MKSPMLFNVAVIMLNAALISCSCNSEKGTDYFAKKDASAEEATGVLLSGGASSGSSGGSDSGSVTAGSSSSGGSSSGLPAGSTTAGSTTAGSSAGNTTAGNTTAGTTGMKPPVPSEKDICEPMKEDGEEIVEGYGLAGKLYDGAPNKIQHFSELLEKGKLLDGVIYMSKLNVPTRKFEKGFPREDGTMVMNSMGQVLMENFGIEFSGSLSLLPEDGDGYYEIGVISDDGSVLDVEADGKMVSIISGDHTTPSKFFCSNNLVRMEAGKPVPMRLRYFQGPRYHIALIMMWRKVQSLEGSSESLIKNQVKQPIKETRCGIAGNKFFFDPDSNSQPQMEYLDLFDPKKREIPWKIIQHRNFKLPVGYSNIECVTKKP